MFFWRTNCLCPSSAIQNWYLEHNRRFPNIFPIENKNQLTLDCIIINKNVNFFLLRLKLTRFYKVRRYFKTVIEVPVYRICNIH
jgi:hypothetical protein